MKAIKNNLILLGLTVMMACSDETEPTVMISQDAEVRALELIDGTIREKEKETEEGIAAWKVEVITTEGAEVEFYFSQEDNSLLRIDGESAPFDYDLNPGNGLLSFQDAHAIGDDKTDSTLEKWRLRRDDSFDNIWVYKLEYDGMKITINAETGDILEIEN